MDNYFVVLLKNVIEQEKSEESKGGKIKKLEISAGWKKEDCS